MPGAARDRRSRLPDVVRTTCPYCGVGCGLSVSRDSDGWSVRGDDTHPSSRVRVCSKGAASGETLSLDGRLLCPEISGARVEWDEALAAIADGLRRAIKAHGPEPVVFYVSGQLLTEDYYVANKLMKGFIGSANIDTNSRLYMSSPWRAISFRWARPLHPSDSENAYSGREDPGA